MINNEDIRIGLIDNGDQVFQSLIPTLCDGFLSKRVLPFLGAGISASAPSCLPLAPELNKPLLGELLKVMILFIKQTDNHSHLSQNDVWIAKNVIKNARLEKVLDAFHQSYGDEIFDYMSILDRGTPNANHLAFAKLSLADYLPSIITLNFDRLLEKAIVKLGGACETVCPLSDKPSIIFGKNQLYCKIIKPHGTFCPPEYSKNSFEYISVESPLRNRAKISV